MACYRRGFRKVHPKFKTPSTGTAVTGISAAIIGGLFPVRILGELVSIGTLMAFVTVCIGVLVLRKTRPDLPRPFRAPAALVTCIARRAHLHRDDGLAGSRNVVAAHCLDRQSA